VRDGCGRKGRMNVRHRSFHGVDGERWGEGEGVMVGRGEEVRAVGGSFGACVSLSSIRGARLLNCRCHHSELKEDLKAGLKHI